MSVYTSTYFDRFLQIALYRKSGVVDYITVPPTGPRPKIQITANLVGAANTAMSLRLYNFYPEVSLSDYVKVEILAGYSGLYGVGGSLGSFSGDVLFAFQESPSPDGITHIQFMPSIHYRALTNTYIESYQFDKGQPVRDVFQYIANRVSEKAFSLGVPTGMELRYDLDPGLTLPIPLNIGGPVLGLLSDLEVMMPNMFKTRFYGSFLDVIPINGSSRVFSIGALSSPPQKSPAGIAFVAPWIPDLLPFDRIAIDPIYAKQNYGSTLIDFNKELIVNTISINFDTADGVNAMTVEALNISEILNE